MALIRRLIAAIGVAFIVVLGTGMAADAAEFGDGELMANSQPELPYSDAGGSRSANQCGVGGGTSDINEAQNLLPVNRWSNIVSYFPRNPDSGITNLDVLIGETSTQMFGGLVFGFSSAMWSLNTSITSMAVNFCPVDHIGGQIDNFVGTLGSVILTGGAPLIAGVVTIVIISMLWQARRGTLAPLKQLVVKGMAIGALAVMTMGANDAWNENSDTWDPPFYSPGGMIVEMNNAAQAISSGSIDSIMDAMATESGSLVPPDERQGSAHCHWMIDSGHQEYSNVVGSGAGLISGLSQTWVGTTYNAWTRALFGDEYSVSNTNPTRDLPHYYIPCRLAEWHADIPNSASDLNDSGSNATPRVAKNHYLNNAFILAGAMPEGQYLSDGTFSPQNTGSAPAIQISTSEDMYWSLVAGLCHNPSFDGDGGLSESVGPDDVNREVDRVWHDSGDLRTLAERLNDASYAEICAGFWTHTDGWESNPMNDPAGWVNSKVFEIHGSRSNIVDNFGGGDANPSAAGQVALVNYMTSNNAGGVTFEGIGSLLASLSVLVVMVPVLIILSLVRLMMVMMMIGLFISLLAALLPKQNFEAFMKTLKMTIGILLLSIFIQVIFAVIMGIMLMLNNIGAEVLGTGGIIYAFWTAVTPWLAVLGVHLTFKFLKLPSPLKLGSAMEWGNAMAKQGADSMGSKAGQATGGAGGAGEKSQGMADKLRKRKDQGNDGSDSRGSGSDRQAGQEQTQSRKGSQRGVLAKVGAGTKAAASRVGSKTASMASKEAGNTAASAAATEKASKAKQLNKSLQAKTKERQLAELDKMRDQKAAGQATREDIKALKAGHKQERQDISSRTEALASKNKQKAKSARADARKQLWASRKQALKDTAVNTGSWADAKRKSLGLQGGQEGRQQRRESLRSMKRGLKSGVGAVGTGVKKGTRAMPGAALRAAAGANKSENLTTKQLAGRAARNAAVVGGVGAIAMTGGAPLAAMGGAAVLGASGLGARRAWNTMTSKNDGSLRSRVGSVGESVRDSLNVAGRDPEVTDGDDQGGAASDAPPSSGGDVPPNAGGDGQPGPTPGEGSPTPDGAGSSEQTPAPQWSNLSSSEQEYASARKGSWQQANRAYEQAIADGASSEDAQDAAMEAMDDYQKEHSNSELDSDAGDHAMEYVHAEFAQEHGRSLEDAYAGESWEHNGASYSVSDSGVITATREGEDSEVVSILGHGQPRPESGGVNTGEGQPALPQQGGGPASASLNTSETAPNPFGRTEGQGSDRGDENPASNEPRQVGTENTRSGAWSPDVQTPEDPAPETSNPSAHSDSTPGADASPADVDGDQPQQPPAESGPDAVDAASDRLNKLRSSAGGITGGAVAGLSAAKRATQGLGDAVENFSPVDDQATIDRQREDKAFREAFSGGDERIPGYNAPAEDPDSRERSLEDKGGYPPRPPEVEPTVVTEDDFAPDAHHSGEDLAARMRRVRRQRGYTD